LLGRSSLSGAPLRYLPAADLRQSACALARIRDSAISGKSTSIACLYVVGPALGLVDCPWAAVGGPGPTSHRLISRKSLILLGCRGGSSPPFRIRFNPCNFNRQVLRIGLDKSLSSPIHGRNWPKTAGDWPQEGHSLRLLLDYIGQCIYNKIVLRSFPFDRRMPCDNG